MNNLPLNKSGLIRIKDAIITEVHKGPNYLLIRLIVLTVIFILIIIWLPNSSIEINIKLNDSSVRAEQIEAQAIEAEQMSLLPLSVDASVDAHSVFEHTNTKAAPKKRSKTKLGPDWMRLSKSALDEKQLFVLKYYKVALQEQEKYCIPASIKLAQAIVESNAGNSKLFKKANNAFGIKGKGPAGFVRADDDAPREKFRKYESVWQSFRDHSLFLQRDNYKRLKHAKGYKQWAKGLKRCGYATAPHYASLLIQTIEKYKLYEFDK